ncbi:hypothetical protein N9Y17_00495 [Gammaproteobacteria bacterium]|nr:hypothetical protein [Gammaproteobacteria bacterium]
MPIYTLEDLKQDTTYQSFSKVVHGWYQNNDVEYVDAISEIYELINFVILEWEAFRSRLDIKDKKNSVVKFNKKALDDLTNGKSENSIDWKNLFEDIQKTQENYFEKLKEYALNHCQNIEKDHPLCQVLSNCKSSVKESDKSENLSDSKKNSEEDNQSGVVDQYGRVEKKGSNDISSISNKSTNQLIRKTLNKNSSQPSMIDSQHQIKSGEFETANNKSDLEDYQSASNNSGENKTMKKNNLLESNKRSSKSQNTQKLYMPMGNNDLLELNNQCQEIIKQVESDSENNLQEKKYNSQSDQVSIQKLQQPTEQRSSSVNLKQLSKSKLDKEGSQASQYNQNDQLKSSLTSSLNEKTSNPKIDTDNNSYNEIQSEKGNNNLLSQKYGSITGLIIGVITGAVIWHFNLQILPQLLMFPNLVILGMIGLVIGYGIDCYSEKSRNLDLSDQTSDQEKKSHLLQKTPGQDSQYFYQNNDENSQDKSHESEHSNQNGIM